MRGCYAYTARFSAAIELVRAASLGRLVSATYPLARYRDAIEHAANAGPAWRGQDRVRPRASDDDPPENGMLMPRPGFVLDVDRSTPPLLFWHGEGFRLERLSASGPESSAPEPLEPLERPQAAIAPRWLKPLGDSKPLPALLFGGMKPRSPSTTCRAVAPMRQPDVHPRVIEAVLDLAAGAGVDDVHLIAALGADRRMTEAELRHAVGDGVYDAFAPSGRLYSLDAEDPRRAGVPRSN